MMIAPKYVSIPYFHLIIVILGSWLWIQLGEADDSFPNIFQHMIGKDRFRFYYELNWFNKDNQTSVASKLVDESYSFGLNSGRLLVNNGAPPKKQVEYSIFYWFSGPKFQEYFWLRPFICPAGRREASAAPTESGMLFEQYCLHEMLTFKGQSSNGSGGQFIFQGLAALLANTVEQHADNLHRVRLENRPQPSPSDPGTSDEPQKQQQQDDGSQSRWLLDTKSGYWLEFNFQKWDPQEELSFDHIVGLRIILFKSIVRDCDRVPGPMVAQITVLKANYQFPDNLVRLPKGYSCHHIGTLVPPERPKTCPLTSGLVTKYTIEVTITTSASSINPPGSQTNSAEVEQRRFSREPLSLPEPVDSMTAPTSNSSLMVLLVNREENSLSVGSRIRKPANNFHAYNQLQVPTLNVWDFNTKRYYKLYGPAGPCQGPLEFKSSLQLRSGGWESEPEAGSRKEEDCSSVEHNETVVVRLSEALGLRLTSDGLRWLMFELQDRQKLAQLVDYSEISDGLYELNYETPTRFVNLCLFYLKSGKPLEYDSTKLMTRYWYSLKLDRLFPKSSSLQFLDDSLSKLILKVDLRLAHQSPFDPWTTSGGHLIDLRACANGYRQSAKLLLEYPLSSSNEMLLKQVKDPHHILRSAIFNHLRSNYLLTLARVPTISVSIGQDLISIVVQLLGQSNLLFHESSELLAATNVTSARYMVWLRSATRSVLVNNVQSCADYCQLYQCQVYVFCKYSISCYIYSASSVASNNSADAGNHPHELASYYGLYMSCSAFKVAPARDGAEEQGAGYPPSLEEILESIYGAVNNQIESDTIKPSGRNTNGPQTHPLEECITEHAKLPTILVSPSLKSDGSRSGKILRLIPSYAHYQFDNGPNESPASESRVPSLFQTPDDFGRSRSAIGLLRNQEQVLGLSSNFRVALGGHRLLEISQLRVVKHHDELQHLDLLDTGGYISIEDATLNDCLRLCLADTNCASVSYCPAPGSHCLVSFLNQTGLDGLKLALDQQLQPQQQEADFGQVDSSRLEYGGLFSRIKLQEDNSCTIMMRTYSDQFQRLELKMMFTYAGQSSDDVIAVVAADNPEDCATKCVLNRLQGLALNTATSVSGNSTNKVACLSYDFCQPINNPSSSSVSSRSCCILYSRHLVSKSEHLNVVQGDHHDGESPAGSSPTDDGQSSQSKDLLALLKEYTSLDTGFCWHHVRNYLSDFHKINGRRLPHEMRSLVLRNYVYESCEGQASGEADDSDDNLHIHLSTDSSEPASPDGAEGGTDISLAHCAQLCEGDPNCGAFEYCAMSQRDAPGGLYLGCSLGSNETLALVPIGGGGVSGGTRARTKAAAPAQPQRYVRDLIKLQRYKYCSVYVYKALALIVGHKKKNLRQIAMQNSPTDIPENRTIQGYNFWFDLLLLFLFSLFFLFGFTARHSDLNQLTFYRLGRRPVFNGRAMLESMVSKVRSSFPLGTRNVLTMKMWPGGNQRPATESLVELNSGDIDDDLTELETMGSSATRFPKICQMDTH